MQTITRKSYTGKVLTYTVIGDRVIGDIKYFVCLIEGVEVLIPAQLPPNRSNRHATH